MPIIIDLGESKKIDYDSDDSYEAKKRRRGGKSGAKQSNSNGGVSGHISNVKGKSGNSNDKEKDENQNNARDMDDVLNLKVYHVKIKTQPFYIDPMKVSYGEKKIIGEKEAVEDEDIILRLNEPVDEDGDGVADLTTMQRIRQEKLKNSKFIDKIKASQLGYFEKCYKQTKMIKTGQKIVIENPSILEVIDWAVIYVNTNEDTIKSSLNEFHDMAVKFAEDREKGSPGKKSPLKSSTLRKGSPSPPNKGGMKLPDQPNKTKGLSNREDESNSHHRRKNPVAYLAHQLDALEHENRAAFVHAITIKPPTPNDQIQDYKFNRNNARRQSTSHLSSVSSASIIAPQNHSNITPVPPSGIKKSKSNLRRGSMLSSTAIGEQIEIHGGSMVGNEKKLINEKIHEDNDDEIEGSEGSDIGKGKGKGEEDNEKPIKTVRINVTEEDISTTTTLVNEPEDNGALIIKLNNDSGVTASTPNIASTSSSDPPVNKVDPSSKGRRGTKIIEEVAAKVNIGSIKYSGKFIDGELKYNKSILPKAGQREIEYQEAQILSNIKMVTYELQKRKGNMKSLCEDIRESFAGFDSSTKKVISHWSEFSQAMEKCTSDFKNQCIEHKFNRDSKISTKMKLIDWDNLSNKGVNYEMRKLSHMSEIATQNSYIVNIVKESWFIKGLTGLNEFSKKTHNQLPISCIKFLVVIQMCLQRGYQITQESFYILLEKTVDGADHIQLIVHRAIKFVREAVSIGPETFLRYLESKNIQPCPELLTQIRNNKKHRDKKLMKFKRNNSGSRQSLTGTPSFKSINELNEEQLNEDRQSLSTPLRARGGLLNNNDDIVTIATSDNLSEKSEDDFSDS